MQNLTAKQRQFVKLFRAGRRSVPAMLRTVRIEPHRLMTWMRNPSFRREIDVTGKAQQLVGTWETMRLSILAATRTAKILNAGKDLKLLAALVKQFQGHVFRQMRDTTVRKAKRPPRPPIIHPSRAHRAHEMMDFISRGRA